MSWDNDRDHSDWLNGPYVRAACIDCGGDVVTDCDPTGAVCEECCDKRDAHNSALELRMAKAALVTRAYELGGGVVEVALVPVDPASAGPVVDVRLVPMPPGYLPWLDSLRANAKYGSDALARAWYVSPIEYHQHLLTVAPDLWLTLKAIAQLAA